MSICLALVGLLSATHVDERRTSVPHKIEILVFASAVAAARTVKEECPGVVIDDAFLEAMRQKLHVVEADYPAYASEAHAAAESLKRGMSESPSATAWCDAAMRLYGPAGTFIPGLVRQEDLSR